ncbi:hypothetical protein BD769DRAFT_1675680 [Suillus cothurnatus]|nr:hypothetical protein BD769DRAFT_1675680 [Suillus cothurnatus]
MRTGKGDLSSNSTQDTTRQSEPLALIGEIANVHPYPKIGLGVLSSTAKIILAKMDRDAAIVPSSWDTTVRLWDAVTRMSVGMPLRGHTDSVDSVSFSPDGTRIVTGSSFEGDTTVALFNNPCPISVSFVASRFCRVLNYPHLPVISTVA